MCVCMYVCKCVCMYVCVCLRVYVHMPVSVFICVYMYVCMQVCVHVCECVCTCMCVCVCMCVYMCECVCTSVCVCVHPCGDTHRERGETPSHGLGKETYISNVEGLQGELVHSATFEIVFQVVVRDEKNLLNGVRFVPVELDVDSGICAGPRDVPRLQADVIAEVCTVQGRRREGRG